MSDPVNSPDHYRWLPGDLEVIDITEGMSFCHGNVVKYVLRADHKGSALEDLRKAAWYLDREIARREAEGSCGDEIVIADGLGVEIAKFGCPGCAFCLNDRLKPFNTPGYTPLDDDQIIRGTE